MPSLWAVENCIKKFPRIIFHREAILIFKAQVSTEAQVFCSPPEHPFLKAQEKQKGEEKVGKNCKEWSYWKIKHKKQEIDNQILINNARMDRLRTMGGHDKIQTQKEEGKKEKRARNWNHYKKKKIAKSARPTQEAKES